jgi:hypothetical protein
VRGALNKLLPFERFVAGARFIAAAGIRPVLFCRAMAAAVTMCLGGEAGYRSADELLTRHCGLDRQRDALVAQAVHEGLRGLV